MVDKDKKQKKAWYRTWQFWVLLGLGAIALSVLIYQLLG